MYDTTELWAFLVGFALKTAILSLFLIKLRRVLLTVEPQNRAMGPNLVWLNLIPFVDFVWPFVTVFKVRDSVRDQYRGWGRMSKDNAFPAGLVSVIGYLISQLLSILSVFVVRVGLDVASSVVFLAALVAWIVYWANISSQKNALEHTSLEFSGGRPMAAPVPVAPAGVVPVGPEGQGQAAGVAPEGQAVQGAPITCGSCGFTAPPGEVFCRSCGANLVEPPVAAGAANCVHCGTPYRPGGRFCPSCGRPAAQTES